ncbi:MAG: hypothetical protein ACLQAN_04885 [Acidimicrobiales bacterium]
MVGATRDEETASNAQFASRAQAEVEQVREAEFRAVLRELAIKDAYIEEAEREFTRSENSARAARDELAEVRARAAELFADLVRAEASIAGLNGEIARLNDEIASIRATRSYRWSAAAVTLLNRLVSPMRRLRRRGRPSDVS